MARGRRTADLLSAVRIPLALAFPFVSERRAAGAAGGRGRQRSARRPARAAVRQLGLGAVIDPVADKLFMASAFGVVALSGRLEWYEILGVLLRDIVATIAFVGTFLSRRPRAIPARAAARRSPSPRC